MPVHLTMDSPRPQSVSPLLSRLSVPRASDAASSIPSHPVCWPIPQAKHRLAAPHPRAPSEPIEHEIDQGQRFYLPSPLNPHLPLLLYSQPPKTTLQTLHKMSFRAALRPAGARALRAVSGGTQRSTLIDSATTRADHRFYDPAVLAQGRRCSGSILGDFRCRLVSGRQASRGRLRARE